jgi:hypothetical protein
MERGVFLRKEKLKQERNDVEKLFVFYNHEFIGGKIVRELFPMLKFDNYTTNTVRFLINHHMRLHNLTIHSSKKSFRKFIREINTTELRTLLYNLSNADRLGNTTEKFGILSVGNTHDDVIEIIEQIIIDEKISDEKPFKYFNGYEIMELLNISGKDVNKAIKIMFELQDIYGPNKDKTFIAKNLIQRFKSLPKKH